MLVGLRMSLSGGSLPMRGDRIGGHSVLVAVQCAGGVRLSADTPSPRHGVPRLSRGQLRCRQRGELHLWHLLGQRVLRLRRLGDAAVRLPLVHAVMNLFFLRAAVREPGGSPTRAWTPDRPFPPSPPTCRARTASERSCGRARASHPCGSSATRSRWSCRPATVPGSRRGRRGWHRLARTPRRGVGESMAFRQFACRTVGHEGCFASRR
jgi:hypothetical protein